MKIDAWYVCILCYGICIPTGNCSVRSYLLLYGPGLHKDLSKMDIEDCRFCHKNSLPGSAMNPWVAVTGLLNSSYFSRLVLKICSTSRRLCCVSDLMDQKFKSSQIAHVLKSFCKVGFQATVSGIAAVMSELNSSGKSLIRYRLDPIYNLISDKFLFSPRK